MTHPTVIRPAEHAVYSPDKMGKARSSQSPRLLVGLNAFEPGQSHALHAHAGMDKVYSVVEGEGLFLLEGPRTADARRRSARRPGRRAARRAQHRPGTAARAGDPRAGAEMLPLPDTALDRTALRRTSHGLRTRTSHGLRTRLARRLRVIRFAAHRRIQAGGRGGDSGDETARAARRRSRRTSTDRTR